ncbi:MAG: precorrin-6Y C5,15-methyltransferase subunit CbiT [Acaryochloris sp. RU_4_1]|nr:precorrin-6Y C5,15-methyltransferase subunit CbiT [Acaryochloris sp. RU_4_1]NJN37451.1 precorrin-6Y C5,15-methyltransferase subunit CbiT [Acaryochloridaceae cyanobacterium CSU_3_4]NJR54092.1 precorrin-6Y C5,15-methyltransferase subunit CbiT [Acaryochloris sp. CRU_2_0]
MSSALWPYISPGIPDELFERLPGIPMTQRDTRLLLISQLRLLSDTILWDIGAGTGTIPVETGLLCPQGQIVAIERDEEVVNLIQANCDRFAVENVEIIQGNAPACLADLELQPNRICIEGGHPMQEILKAAWHHLQPQGRLVASASSLEILYIISETFAKLQARNIEVVQSVINHLEMRGTRQTFAAVDPMFILSGEKL